MYTLDTPTSKALSYALKTGLILLLIALFFGAVLTLSYAVASVKAHDDTAIVLSDTLSDNVMTHCDPQTSTATLCADAIGGSLVLISNMPDSDKAEYRRIHCYTDAALTLINDDQGEKSFTPNASLSHIYRQCNKTFLIPNS